MVFPNNRIATFVRYDSSTLYLRSELHFRNRKFDDIYSVIMISYILLEELSVQTALV